MKLGSFGFGFSLGFGTGFLIREVLPVLKEILAPVVRLSVKGSIKAIERSREGLMRMGEEIEDLIAEVQGELKRGKVKPSRVIPKAKRGQKHSDKGDVSPELREVA